MRVKEKISTTELAQMWCDLNSWKRPAKLKHILPEDLHKDSNNVGYKIMQVIELAIGTKPINIQWKKHCDKSEKKFN